MGEFRRTALRARGRLFAPLVPLVLAFAWLCADRTAQAAKPTDEAVLKAISRGADYLKKWSLNGDGGHADLAALAILKAGADPEDPYFTKIVEQKLLPKFEGGTYKSSQPTWLYYEAGVDLMLLSNLHRDQYRKQMQMLVDVLLEGQYAPGFWYYPPAGRYDHGDMSITQYALLGLWDAQRAGMQIPSSVWDKAASWFISVQESNGGFVYHPGSAHQAPTMSMTAAGTSNLLVCRLMLYGAGRTDNSSRQNQSRFGVLKRVDLDPAPEATGAKRAKSSGPAHTTRSSIEGAARRGIGWLADNWVSQTSIVYRYYYYYALERACTLAGIDRVGDHDWYDEISDRLIKEQFTEGSWNDGGLAGPAGNTAFVLLFLSRATSRSLGHGEQAKLFGGGLMVGGRGLPTNLGAVQTGAEGITIRKLDKPVDQLLSELENPNSTQVEAVQKAIVETVQVGDREKLIGQKSRLRKLAHDPRAEVRRTAIWALGRCSTIHDALVFIKALDDTDFGVAVEANSALCWLSRRPNGFGHPVDPLGELPENTPQARKQEVARAWRAQVRTEWRSWFDTVSPYAEQNLPIDLP